MLTYAAIEKNKRESWILILCFLIIIALLGYVFSVVYNNLSILYFAVGFSLISAWFSYYFSDSVTLAISRAQEVNRTSAPEYYKIVENLAITAGLPMPKIYIINDPAPNAFATGRDPKHAVVCATTGILQKLDKTELEGVIAHELSHIGNYDIRLMTLVVVLVGAITLLADFFLRFSFFGGMRGRRSNNSEGGQITALLAIIGLILAILSPLIATLIKLAVSRQREYLADASGVMLTRYPEGLASALEKIAQDGEAMQHANNATAHLYIANPFKADTGNAKGHFFAHLFDTHPPLEDRIKRLRSM